MRETRQHEQVASLWYLAWTRERQEMLRLERQARIRTWLGGATFGENATVPLERAWWDNRRTLRLELKTKRFHSSMVVLCGMQLQPGQTHEIGISSSRPIDDEETDAEVEGGSTFDGNAEAANENTCAICLCQMQDGDTVGDIPCKHLFHKGCLKSWLTRSNRCPLCQKDVLQINGGSSLQLGSRPEDPRVGDDLQERE